MTGYFQYTKITDGVLAAARVLPRLVDWLFGATSASPVPATSGSPRVLLCDSQAAAPSALLWVVL